MKKLLLVIAFAASVSAETAQWNPVPGVNRYRLDYGPVAQGYTQSQDVPSTSATVQLSPGTTYKFRVYSLGAQYCWSAIPNIQPAGCDYIISAPSAEIIYASLAPTPAPISTPPVTLSPFSIQVTPATLTIAPRGWTASCTITLTRTPGFTAPVSFTWSGISGVTGSFSPPSATGTTKKAVMTLTIDDCLPAGSYPFAVIATGETPAFPTATKNATLVKQKP